MPYSGIDFCRVCACVWGCLSVRAKTEKLLIRNSCNLVWIWIVIVNRRNDYILALSTLTFDLFWYFKRRFFFPKHIYLIYLGRSMCYGIPYKWLHFGVIRPLFCLNWWQRAGFVLYDTALLILILILMLMWMWMLM